MKISEIPLGAILYLGSRYSVYGSEDKIRWAKVSGDNDFFAINKVDGACFDLPEPGSTSRVRREGGNNFYPLSNIHQWLNAYDESDGNWVMTHKTDAIPYGRRCGFLGRFDSFERDLLREREYVVSVPPGSVKEFGKSVTVHSKVTLPAASELFENFSNDTVHVSEGEFLPMLKRINTWGPYVTRTGANSPAQVVFYDGGVSFSRAKNYFQIHPMIRLDGEAEVFVSDTTNGIDYYEVVRPETQEEREWNANLNSILGF